MRRGWERKPELYKATVRERERERERKKVIVEGSE